MNVTLSGNKIELFLTDEDIQKLKGLVTNTETPTQTTTVPTTGASTGNSYKVIDNGGNVRVDWNIQGGSGNYSYRLGDNIYHGSMNAPKNVDWTVTIIDNGTRKEYPVSVSTKQLGLINFNGTVVIPPPTVETPTTPAVVVQTQTPTQVNNNFAEVGKEYFSKSRGKLILPTRENSKEAQIFKASKDGVEIVSYDRHQWWDSESSYWGNHPAEWQPAIDNGKLDFYFKNTGTKPIIVGFTTGNHYSFYGVPGELAKTDYHKELEAGQEHSFSVDFYTSQRGTFKNWDKTKLAWHFNSFFYENGVPTTDKVEVQDRENGLEICNEKETHRFFKKSDPSKNIVIEFTTRGEHQDAKL